MNIIRFPDRPIPVPPAAPPVHVAIIMDGNGRWAKARNLSRTFGHRRGVDAVARTVEAAVGQGVQYLTLFAFSSENWNRPEAEIEGLMTLLRRYLTEEVRRLDEKDVRLRVIGERSRLAPDIVALIDDAERQTCDNQKLTLTIALSYGGRAEIVNAVRGLAAKVADGVLDPHEIDETTVAENLLTADIPDPDLLIRTSGEQRISNFLIWQLAYTEFVFVDTPWPDFSQSDFENAVVEFKSRERRFGKADA
jgi:undecaprenyl diphosphate synthase